MTKIKTKGIEKVTKIVEKIINNKTEENGTYWYESSELIYAACKGFAEGYGINLDGGIYQIDSNLEKLTKEIKEIIEKIITRYTGLVSIHTVVNAINGVGTMGGTKRGLENMVKKAYECGEEFRKAYDNAMAEIIRNMKI